MKSLKVGKVFLKYRVNATKKTLDEERRLEEKFLQLKQRNIINMN